MKYSLKLTTLLLAAMTFSGWGVVAQDRSSVIWPIEALPIVQKPVFKADTFNIKNYGAVKDGVTLNTKSINDAIADCSSKGGGVVLIPEGLWSTGPIELKSNVNLHLSSNAVLSFTKDLSQYKLIESNFEGMVAVRNQSPVTGNNLENIAITGQGVIDGSGDAWRPVKKEKMTEGQWKKLVASGGVLSDNQKIWYPTESALKGSKSENPGAIKDGKTANDYQDIKDFLRPNMVALNSCKKVLLEGVVFQNSPAWNVHPLMCEDLTVRNIMIRNPWFAQNGDGIDVESCINVLIENSVFDVGDDAICIKSGRDEQGRKRGMPTENVLVRNCTVYHGHGGFVVGSEMSGGARNIFVTNCTFIGTDIGLRFKTTRGRGGVVEKVYIKDIAMKDIPGEAILFDMYYGSRPVPFNETATIPSVPVTEATPQFKDFYVTNLVCEGAARGVFIRGLPEMHIRNINLENMTLRADKGVEIEEATGISLKNIRLVTELAIPVVSIINGNSLTFDNLAYEPGSKTLFDVKGAKNANITVLNTNIDQAGSRAQFNFGASKKAIKFK